MQKIKNHYRKKPLQGNQNLAASTLDQTVKAYGINADMAKAITAKSPQEYYAFFSSPSGRLGGAGNKIMDSINKSGLSDDKKKELKEKALQQMIGGEQGKSTPSTEQQNTTNNNDFVHQNNRNVPVTEATHHYADGSKTEMKFDTTRSTPPTPPKKWIKDGAGDHVIENPLYAEEREQYEQDLKDWERVNGGDDKKGDIVANTDWYPESEDELQVTVTKQEMRQAIVDRLRITLNTWDTNNDPRIDDLVMYGCYANRQALLDIVNVTTAPSDFASANSPIFRFFDDRADFVDFGTNRNIVRSNAFPALQTLISDWSDRLQRNPQTNQVIDFVNGSSYAVTCTDKAIYLDMYASMLVRDIVQSQKTGTRYGGFSNTGLYSQSHVNAVWDFLMVVISHEMCHWGRLNDTYFPNLLSANEKVDIGVTPIIVLGQPSPPRMTRPTPTTTIEHGNSWETKSYGKTIQWSDRLAVSPNVYAMYLRAIAPTIALYPQPLRRFLDIRFSSSIAVNSFFNINNRRYYQMVRGELQPTNATIIPNVPPTNDAILPPPRPILSII
jgi:hypothetical protein